VTTGPEEEAAAGHGHLRAAHADREHAIDMLKTAFADGRLTKDELDARAGQALTARTYAQLAALTADIPAGPPAARPPRQAARPQDGPARTLSAQNAAIGSVSCLIVGAAAFLYGASLDDHKTLLFLFLAFFAFMVGLMLAAGAAVQQRRSRRQLPPRPGQGGQAPAVQRHGSTGHDPSPPGTRTDQTSTDLRDHRPRPDRPRPSGQGVPVPRSATPAPGTA
jgi:Domain of unknown function (DUF1707)